MEGHHSLVRALCVALVGLTMAMGMLVEGSEEAPPFRGGDSSVSEDIESYTSSGGSVTLEDQYDEMVVSLHAVSEAEIKKEIQGAAEEYSINPVDLTSLVHDASVWADITSLNVFWGELERRGVCVFATGDRATLADVTRYFKVKQKPKHTPKRDMVSLKTLYCTEERIRNLLEGHEDASKLRPVILVDHILAKLMASDKQILVEVRTMVQAGAGIIALDGWLDGINMMNQVHWRETVGALARAYARHLAAHPDKDGQSVRQAVIRAPVQHAVTSLNTKESPLKPDVIFISHPDQVYTLDTAPSPATIATNMRPHYPSFDEYKGTIRKATMGCETSSLPLVLQQLQRVYSMRTLGELSRRIHDRVIDRFGRDNEPWYYIAGKDKSFVFSVHLYLSVNREADPSRVLHSSSFLDKGKEKGSGEDEMTPVASVTLVLDDYVGSGESLEEVVDELVAAARSRKLFQGTVRVVPAALLTSRVAAEGRKDELKELIFGEIVESLCTRKGAMGCGGGDNDEEMQLFLGAPGFLGHYFLVALPYMAPDNNCALMSKFLAKLFTLNGNGVKDTAAYYPLCNEWDRAYAALRRGLYTVWGQRTGWSDREKWMTLPKCFSVVIQHYCKVRTTDAGSCPFIRDTIRTDLEHGRWEGLAYARALKPSPVCAETAAQRMIDLGFLDTIPLPSHLDTPSAGDRGTPPRTAYSLRPCREVCEALNFSRGAVKLLKASGAAFLFGWREGKRDVTSAVSVVSGEKPTYTSTETRHTSQKGTDILCAHNAALCTPETRLLLLDMHAGGVPYLKNVLKSHGQGELPRECVSMIFQYYCQYSKLSLEMYLAPRKVRENFNNGQFKTGFEPPAKLTANCVEDAYRELVNGGVVVDDGADFFSINGGVRLCQAFKSHAVMEVFEEPLKDASFFGWVRPPLPEEVKPSADKEDPSSSASYWGDEFDETEVNDAFTALINQGGLLPSHGGALAVEPKVEKKEVHGAFDDGSSDSDWG